MENKTKKWIQKSSQCKKFAIFSIIIFILERKEKVPNPLVPTPLDLFYNLTLFWSWQTVWDTKLLSWTNHQPKIKTCFNYCIAASKCASVCKFCRKMSGNTTKNTTTKKKTPPASTEINEIRLPYTYTTAQCVKINFEGAFFRIKFNPLCTTWLLIHSRTHISVVSLVCGVGNCRENY